MRAAATCVLLLGAIPACSDDGTPATDAGIDAPALDSPAEDDATDGPPPDGCTPRELFTGGVDPTVQGWTVLQGGPATVTVMGSATILQTSTPTGATSGGYLLLGYDLGLAVNAPFAIDVELLVYATAPHNQYDAGAAILGSYLSGLGSATDRGQMVYIDPSRLGWADDTGMFAADGVDGVIHTYRFAVDAAGTATVARDGVPALSRPAFVGTGRIAIGDQSNDPGVDAKVALYRVTLRCP